MFCSFCGKEILTCFEEEWARCPVCNRYTRTATKLKPKTNLNESTLPFLTMQSFGILLALIFMVFTETLVVRFEEISTLVAFIFFFIFSIYIAIHILLIERQRDSGDGHFIMCLGYQIMLHAPYIYLLIVIIRNIL